MKIKELLEETTTFTTDYEIKDNQLIKIKGDKVNYVKNKDLLKAVMPLLRNIAEEHTKLLDFIEREINE